MSKSGKHVIFRADGSTSIGLGHLVRCLALAEEFRRIGADVTFVCRESGGLARRLLRERSLSLVEIPDSMSEADDAHNTLSISRSRGAVAVVVDHYELGNPWWKTVATACPLGVIDDEGRSLLGEHVMLVLNQNIAAERSWYPRISNVLCGPRYALLRAEFREALGRRKRRGRKVQRLLVTLGGSDPDNITSFVLRALRDVPELPSIDVVVGPGFIHQDSIHATADADPRIRLHVYPVDMAELMCRADLALTAAGSTVYEAASLGLPMVLVQIADNQNAVGIGMQKAGAACFLGDADGIEERRISGALRELLTHPETLVGMSTAARALVDGRGATRVARHILRLSANGPPPEPGLSLRRADLEDARLLLAWRNDELTRRVAISSGEITYEGHRAWLRRTLGDPEVSLLIGELDGTPAGQIRFDLHGPIANVSISLGPPHRGRGLGRALLVAGLDWLLADVPRGDLEFRAQIKPDNDASRRLFRQVGFTPHGSVEVRGTVVGLWRLRRSEWRSTDGR